ncbi:hypothetical protein pb186bvf_012583 [Paramecium bursaria]
MLKCKIVNQPFLKRLGIMKGNKWDILQQFKIQNNITLGRLVRKRAFKILISDNNLQKKFDKNFVLNRINKKIDYTILLLFY